MSIGRTARRVLGRHEARVSAMYRGAFLDTKALATAVRPYAAGPRLLEIGCGDGFVTAALTRGIPGCHVTGIDIAPTPGQLYDGDPGRAEFRSCSVEAFAATAPEPFDLVLVVDVLHHVDDDVLAGIVRTAASLVRPGGHLVVKEWERNRTIGFWAGWFSDRVVSGQRVRFFDRDALVRAVETVSTSLTRVADDRVRPRRSNLVVVWQRPAEVAATS